MIRAEFNGSALLHNLRMVRKNAPDSKVLAMVKADAYGHGALEVASRLTGRVEGFGVARVSEGVALREYGITDPIVVVEGASSEQDTCLAQSLGLTLILHQRYQVNWCRALAQPLAVWVKVDTGMHRLGFATKDVMQVLEQIQGFAHLSVQTVMTHLACIAEPNHPYTSVQLERFVPLQNVIGERYPAVEFSIGNSAYILNPIFSDDFWVRPGIMLYGASPFLDQSAASHGLQPVMTLTAPILAVRHVAIGESVGYGATWSAKRETVLGVIGIGYGDGYPRVVDGTAHVFYRDKTLPIVGRISMDKLAIDMTDFDEDIQLDDRVELWGQHVALDHVARSCGTIGYELACKLTQRVSRCWVD